MLKKEETPIAITKNDLKQLQQNLEAVIQERLREALAREFPHTCSTCRFFFKVEGNRNKSCNVEEKIEVADDVCLNWRLQVDPKKRRWDGRIY